MGLYHTTSGSPVEVKHITRKANTANLPVGYTQLEYIQSTGTQYIDSGIVPASFDYEIETEFAFDSVNSGLSPFCAWGYMGLNSLPRWLLASYQSGYLLNVNTTSKFGGQNTNKHTFNGKVLLDGTTPKWNCSIDGVIAIDDTTVLSESSFTSNTLSIYLFARHNVNPDETETVGNYASGKLYRHTVKKAGSVIQNLIPAKNSYNVVGLYDTVTGTFFTNDGTGTFTAGPTLEQKVNYLIRKVNNTEKLVFADSDLYLSGPKNYTVVGSPTIVDGVMSNFSDSNLVKSTENFVSDSGEVEFVIAVEDVGSTTKSFGTYRNFYRANLSMTSGGVPYWQYSDSGVFYAWGVTIPSTGLVYLRYKLSSTNLMTIGCSTDGVTYTEESTQLSERPTLSYSEPFEFGGYDLDTVSKIHLNKSYVKLNGDLWLYGKVQASANIAPVPSGFTYGSTTTSAIGFVDMRTQAFYAAPEGTGYCEVPVPPTPTPSGIDANTLLCCHFDDDNDDSSQYEVEPARYNGSGSPTTGTSTYTTGKFSNCLSLAGSYIRYYHNKSADFQSAKEATIDWWMKKTTISSDLAIKIAAGSYSRSERAHV